MVNLCLTDQDVCRWFVEAGQHVDGLCREVSPLLGPLAGPDTPAGVLHRLPGVALVEDDQVALVERQERRALA